MRVAALLLALAASHAAAAGFGDTSMGHKPYGVLIIAPNAGASWRTELSAIRAQMRGIAVESVESSGDGTAIQRAIDRLAGQHVAKIVAVALEPVSESAGMDQLRYLFGIRAEPVQDRPDENRPDRAGPQAGHKTVLITSGKGPKRLRSEPELVLASTIDKSPALTAILADRAKTLSHDPAKEAVVLVGQAPRSDKALEDWKTAAAAIAESVRVSGGFREAAVLWVRDGTRAGQQDKDRDENKATLRRLRTEGAIVAIPLAPEGQRIARLLQRQLGSGTYRWNGKGLFGDPRLADWIGSISKSAAALPDVRQYRDNTPGGFR